MNFSVLMSVYIKENAKFLDRALKSIWDDQEIKPAQIVLVEDGKLTDELYSVIENWQSKLGEILDICALEKNVGLGDALKIGIEKCKFELIARMDSDDVSMPNRFKEQLKIFENNTDIDICGSLIGEFDSDENIIQAYRKLPQEHDKIIKFAKFRSPINHPSVMYKKSAVLAAGSYQKAIMTEDYYLWVRMLLNGAKFHNINKMLVKMRVGNGQIGRRSGLRYAINEFKVQKKFYDLGFLNFFEFVRNICIRLPLRLLPKAFLASIYSSVLRKNK